MMTDDKRKLVWSQTLEERLDKALSSLVQGYSRARLQALIREGNVTLNGAVAQKPKLLVRNGDVIVISIPEVVETELQPEAIPLDILYEDANVVVVNKPAGMVVHPSAGHSSGTLVHAILAHCTDLRGIGGELRPGIVHRLDKDTSGIILVAKNDQTLRFLQEQFRKRLVHKTYIALVDGVPPTPTGRIEAEIARDPAHRKKMAVVSAGRGRVAVTEYETVGSYSQHTLLNARPLTGRTHQIRLHLAFLGTPIVGDRVYGRRKPTLSLSRHFLHAAEIELKLPGEEIPHRFKAELPNELVAALAEIEE